MRGSKRDRAYRENLRKREREREHRENERKREFSFLMNQCACER